MFRLLAVGVPAVGGLVAVVMVLIAQQRLVFDDHTGWLRFQSPPVILYEPGFELTGHRYLYDPRLGWRNIPGWQATTFGQPLVINSQGMRDREHPVQKPPGTRRILVVGDSYAWGYGVGNEQTFAARLEERLNSNAPWEVLNSGVSGWGTDQQYLYLTEEGFRYAPDVVVLALFLVNDPRNNISSMQYGLHKPVFLTTRLELANVPVPLPSSGAPVIQSQAAPLEITFYILEAMLQACHRHGSQLVIMKFGAFMRPDEEFQSTDQLFKLLVQKRLPDAWFLDLDQQFVQYGASWEALVEGNDDNHWNAFGHQLTAQILHRFLADSGLLEEKSDST